MPKTRAIDPSFWEDLDISELTRDERLLVIAMMTTCADDYGRLIAHPKYLRAQAFRYDSDISDEDVAQMRANVLTHCRNLMLYEHDGQEYVWFRNWRKYQSIRYQVDSRLPAPPTENDADLMKSERSLREITENCGNLPESSAHSPRVVLSSVEKSSSSAAQCGAEKSGNDDDANLYGAIFKAWEQTRGSLNSLDADVLKGMVEDYTAQWVLAGIHEANKSSKGPPSLKYLEAILQRWKREGFKVPFRGNQSEGMEVEWLNVTQ